MKRPAYRPSSHVAIQVSDHDAALRFFEGVLGGRVEERGEGESAVTCGGLTFHVEESAASRTFFELETDDLGAAEEELRRLGCELVPVRTPEGTASFLVTTPFGFRFHLHQPR